MWVLQNNTHIKHYTNNHKLWYMYPGEWPLWRGFKIVCGQSSYFRSVVYHKYTYSMILLALNQAAVWLKAMILHAHTVEFQTSKIKCLQFLSDEGVPDEHVSEFDKVTVVLVLHLDHAPWVQTSTYTFPVDLKQCVAAHNGEWHGLLQTINHQQIFLCFLVTTDKLLLK